MIKYYCKCGIAFLFIIAGMLLIFDFPNYMTHKYLIERIVLGGAMIVFGGYYYLVVNARMDSCGRC